MNAIEGGPALASPDAVASAGGGPASTRSAAPGMRTARALASAEAALLVRSVLVLAGLLVGLLVIWIFIHPVEPLWWGAAWEIGYGQLALALTTLVAAHLAAGRARRHALTDLYASFPATAGTRTLGHLMGLAGVAPAGLVMIGAGVALVEVLGPVGAPNLTVLAAGLVLVVAAGAVGVALGTWFPHPLAGLLGALVLLVSSITSHFAWGGGTWLLPWEWRQDELTWLPGPLPGYPPGGLHAVELAGIAVLAGIAGLAATVNRTRVRGVLVTIGIVALALTCLAGALELQPVPAADLNHLVSEVADPASAQSCTTADQVRYCLYPGFGQRLPSLEAPVNAVFAQLPARPAQRLTVRQVAPLSQPESNLTYGHPNSQVSRWDAALQQAPGSDGAAPAATIYLPVATWPAPDGALAAARFDLALSAAEWAVGIPPQVMGNPGTGFEPCVPLNQAREAIAIWLAILATHPSVGDLHNGLGTAGGNFDDVGNTAVRTWNYPGLGYNYVISPGGGPQNTAAGYLLANAMTSLPQQKVSHVLAGAWGSWLNWHTTDAELAAALGLRTPSVSAQVTTPSGQAITPPADNLPQAPLCTA